MEEELARILLGQAEVDQALTATGNLAKLIFAYYNDLLEAGCPEDKAFMLTVHFQNACLNKQQ